MDSGNTTPKQSSTKRKRSKPPGNIIAFPEDRIVKRRTKQGFNEDIVEHKIIYIDNIVENEAMMLIERLHLAHGMNADDDQFLTDMTFVQEALRSALYRLCDMPHGIQKIVDKHFTIETDDE